MRPPPFTQLRQETDGAFRLLQVLQVYGYNETTECGNARAGSRHFYTIGLTIDRSHDSNYQQHTRTNYGMPLEGVGHVEGKSYLTEELREWKCACHRVRQSVGLVFCLSGIQSSRLVPGAGWGIVTIPQLTCIVCKFNRMIRRAQQPQGVHPA